MKLLLLLSRRIDALNRCVGIACRWLLLLMLALGIWNVVGRYLGVLLGRNFSSNSLIEAQWYLFALVFLFLPTHIRQSRGHLVMN